MGVFSFIGGALGVVSLFWVGFSVSSLPSVLVSLSLLLSLLLFILLHCLLSSCTPRGGVGEGPAVHWSMELQLLDRRCLLLSYYHRRNAYPIIVVAVDVVASLYRSLHLGTRKNT